MNNPTESSAWGLILKNKEWPFPMIFASRDCAEEAMRHQRYHTPDCLDLIHITWRRLKPANEKAQPRGTAT